jgi:hypothetical protein
MQAGSPAIDRIKTIVAFTISILTVFSALLGWQMGNVSGEASGEYSAAQRAELNAQKVASINTLNASENQRSFLTYKRYYDQYQLVSDQLRTAENAETKDAALIQDLRQKQLELRALYSSNLKLFPNKFITRAGTYDEETQLGQMWASASRELDLDPTPHLQAGQELDKQVRNMQVALVLLAISLFFFAIVSTVESLKYGMLVAFVAMGYVFSSFGVGFGLLNWNRLSASPFPSPRQTALSTNTPGTPAPAPTAAEPTSTPVPTLIPHTPTPAPQQYYTEEFEGGLEHWSTSMVDRQETPFFSLGGFSSVSLNAGGGGYLFDIQRVQTGVYTLYDPFEYQDVRLDVRVENQVANNINISLICRFSEEAGWYEFNIANNGLYDILYATASPTGYISYRNLYNGGSNNIKAGAAANEYGIVCQGNTLSLFINGELARQVTDHLATLRTGKVGVSVSSFNVLPVSVRLDWIKISQP